MLSKTTKLFVTVAILSLTGCRTSSEVTLKNASSETISNVKLFASENLVWQGSLASGKSISVKFNVDRDGALRVRGNNGDKTFDSDYLGYATPNDGVFHTITYEGSGVTSYEYSTKK